MHVFLDTEINPQSEQLALKGIAIWGAQSNHGDGSKPKIGFQVNYLISKVPLKRKDNKRMTPSSRSDETE